MLPDDQLIKITTRNQESFLRAKQDSLKHDNDDLQHVWLNPAFEEFNLLKPPSKNQLGLQALESLYRPRLKVETSIKTPNDQIRA